MIARSDRPPTAPGTLAARLRALRERELTRRLTQDELARALGGAEPLSAAAISTWENPSSGRLPPRHRLVAYARLFCTNRSFGPQGPRQLADEELTDEERRREGDLQTELLALRERSQRGGAVDVIEQPRATSIWHVPEGDPISVVCSQARNPPAYANPDDPNYVRAARFGDLDTLIEIFGQIRADNPASAVQVIPGKSLRGVLATNHLVAVGGVTSNLIIRDFFRNSSIPITQETELDEHFRCEQNGEVREFKATTENEILTETVGLFLHGPSPASPGKRVTICSGISTRGVHGAALCFIDSAVKNINEKYINDHFSPDETFCLLMRVSVLNLEPLPPDLSREEVRLFQWSGTTRA